MSAGDYELGDTVYLPFTTRAFATGIPTVLAGTPVIEIYEDASVTQITAAETLVVSIDSIVGFNMCSVVATTGNGFGVGQSYTAIISTGTVGGVSVVGEVIGHFTVEMSAAHLRLGAPAGASVSADIATVDTVVDAIPTTAMRGTDSAALASVCTNTRLAELDAANLPTDVAAIPTTAMRGTDNAATATVLGAAVGASISADIAAVQTTTDAIPTTAMRGTDGVSLVVPDAAGVAPTAAEVVNEWETQSQADPTGFHVNVREWLSSAASALETAASVRTEMDSNSTKLATLVGGIIEGTTSGTPTTTSTNTDLTGYVTGELVDRVIVFTGGTANGQAAPILTYTSTNGVVTFAALTTAPAASDPFKII